MHQFPHFKRYGFETVTDDPYADVYSRFHAHPRLSRTASFDEWPHLMGHGLQPNDAGARPWHLEEEFHQTNFAVNKSLQWLDERDLEAPFFLSVGFIAPSSAFVPARVFLRALLPPRTDAANHRRVGYATA